MSSSRGSIPERVRRALYVLSRGRCYAPVCTELVVVIEGEEAVFVGEVAHIVAATTDGPRGSESVPNREAFSNLLLLCGRHHKIVDNVHTRHRYPSAELRRWKKQREAEFDAQTLAELDQLGSISKALPALLVTSLKDTTARLSAEVDRLENAGQLAHHTATLLRAAVDRLPEHDGDLYRAAVMLTDFAHAMGNLHQSALLLAEFAQTTSRSLPDTATSLETFAKFDLEGLTTLVTRLENLTGGDRVAHVVREVESALSRMPKPDDYRTVGEELTASMPSVRPYVVDEDAAPVAAPWASTVPAGLDSRMRFKRGLAAVGAGVLVGAVGVGWLLTASAASAEEDRQACTGPSVPAKFTVTRMVEVDATPSVSPSPYACETWYPKPILRPGRK